MWSLYSPNSIVATVSVLDWISISSSVMISHFLQLCPEIPESGLIYFIITFKYIYRKIDITLHQCTHMSMHVDTHNSIRAAPIPILQLQVPSPEAKSICKHKYQYWFSTYIHMNIVYRIFDVICKFVSSLHSDKNKNKCFKSQLTAFVVLSLFSISLFQQLRFLNCCTLLWHMILSRMFQQVYSFNYSWY